MIRPLTIATFLMACGSGLYLYESKHEVQLLDRTIERTVHDAATLREQSRLLSTEWNMLNDPDRLRQFSDTYLSLKSIDPKQYTSLADLDVRLPAPRVELPATGTVGDGDAADAAPDPVAAPPVVEEKARPAVAATRPASAGRSAETRASEPREHRTADAKGSEAKASEAKGAEPKGAEPKGAEPKGAEPKGAEPKGAEHRTADHKVAESKVAEPKLTDAKAADAKGASERPAGGDRPAAVVEVKPPEPHPPAHDADAEARSVGAVPKPIILASPRPRHGNTAVDTKRQTPNAVPAEASAPYGGSLLGMARGATPPSPRPTPVSTTYNAN